MNAMQMAKTAYTSTEATIKTPRSIEYDAFARVTHRLKTTYSLRTSQFSHFAEALHTNRKLWTALAADVAEPNNGLPKPLRAQIFYLAEFTKTHSRKVLKGEEGIEPLLDINTAIMRGLRNEVSAA